LVGGGRRFARIPGIFAACHYASVVAIIAAIMATFLAIVAPVFAPFHSRKFELERRRSPENSASPWLTPRHFSLAGFGKAPQGDPA
jgi:hypothetical protein